MKMEAESSAEMLLTIYEIARYHNSDDYSLDVVTRNFQELNIIQLEPTRSALQNKTLHSQRDRIYKMF
jgi:hypothetical protein